MQMSHAPFNLPDLSLSQLVEIRAQVEAKICEKRESERAAAAEQIRNIVEAFAFGENDVITILKGIKALPVKYRHPEDPTLTWCGKGRRPLWLNEVLSAGVPIAKVRVLSASAGS